MQAPSTPIRRALDYELPADDNFPASATALKALFLAKPALVVYTSGDVAVVADITGSAKAKDGFKIHVAPASVGEPRTRAFLYNDIKQGAGRQATHSPELGTGVPSSSR